MKVIVTNEYNKINILEKLTKEKRFNDNKFFSFKELKKKLFFDYDNRAIFFIMKNYNVNIDIAKIYLENIYFLKNVDEKKVRFLMDIKKRLDENELLIYNEKFKKYISNQEVIIYGADELLNQDKIILNGINYKVINKENKNNEVNIYEAKDINEEVEFVVTNISKLINEGKNVNNIKIIASKEYNKYLEFYFGLFNIPINIESENSFYSSNIASKFLKLYDNLSIEEAIVKLTNEKNINDLINIVNKSVLVEDKTLRKEFIIEDLKQYKMKNESYKDAVTLHLLDEEFSDEDYVFLLGFNIGNYPKIYKDEDFFSDNVKSDLGLDTSVERNRIEKKKCVNAIKNIHNLIITYNLYNGEKVSYPSVLIEENNYDVLKVQIDRSISYSRLYSSICYAKDLDNLYKYNDEGKYLSMYQNNLNISYREFNNKYTKIDKKLLKERLASGFTLSYTSLESFNECGFKYYLSKVMNLDLYLETFKTIIGKIVHHILEIGLENDIDIELEISKFIKDLDFLFGARELFYIHKLSKELEFLLKYLKEQENFSSLKTYMFEKELCVYKEYDGINVIFKGFIDKVMSTKYNDKEVIAVVDYKTGDKNIKLDTLNYGLNIQLPIYLYLLKKTDEFKDSIIAGFYIERVLNNVFNIDKNKSLEDLKKENLRLQGYTNSNETIISLLDQNYLDSKMVKGLKFKKDGSFYASSKVLSNEDMEKLIITVDEIINDAIRKIIEGEFFINPKVVNGKNVSCEFCKFKDICFKTKEDEVILGGEEDELNA